MFQAEYPDSENAAALGKEYPHKPEDITKTTLSTKLKAVRKKFREAVDSGKKSGHGRVVLLYYELCQEIWGGSPATNTRSSDLESSTLIDDIDVDLGAPDTPATVGVNGDESESLEDEEGPQDDATPTSSTIKHRRELLNSKSKCYKQEKLKRKLPVDNQFLSIAQEELEIKKKLITRMEEVDKENSNQIGRMMTNMEKLTRSIAEGFAMLRQILLSLPQPPMHPHYQPRQSYPNVAPPREYGSDNRQFSYTQALYSQDDQLPFH